MKILLAVLFAVAVPAWADRSSTDRAAQSEVWTDDARATPMDVSSECLDACEQAYAECLGNAGSPSAECNCYNAKVICQRGCGVRRPLIPCPVD